MEVQSIVQVLMRMDRRLKVEAEIIRSVMEYDSHISEHSGRAGLVGRGVWFPMRIVAGVL